MQYFGFVTRGPDRRYRVRLVDLPDCVIPACGVGDLVDTVRGAVDAWLQARTTALPPPTGAVHLPRLDHDHDGYWMLFDLTPVLTGFVPGIARS